MAHSKWTEVEARAALRAWRKSELSAAAFAEKQRLNCKRLYWWNTKLKNRPEDEEVTIVPVTVEAPKKGEPVLVMLRSGHMLKVGRGFDEQAFSRAVAVLEQC